MQYPETGLCWDGIPQLFWKANFILRSIYGGYSSGLIPFPVAPDLQWSTRSFFALWYHPCSSWCQDPGSHLSAEKGQGHPVPPPTPNSSSALLTLGLQHRPPIEYLPRPLPFLMNSLGPAGSFQNLDCIYLALSLAHCVFSTWTGV